MSSDNIIRRRGHPTIDLDDLKRRCAETSPKATFVSFPKEIVPALVAEIEELKAKLAEPNKFLCAFCGHTLTIDPVLVTKHILVCEKHPMRKAESQRDAEAGEVERLKEALRDIIAVIAPMTGATFEDDAKEMRQRAVEALNGGAK